MPLLLWTDDYCYVGLFLFWCVLQNKTLAILWWPPKYFLKVFEFMKLNECKWPIVNKDGLTVKRTGVRFAINSCVFLTMPDSLVLHYKIGLYQAHRQYYLNDTAFVFVKGLLSNCHCYVRWLCYTNYCLISFLKPSDWKSINQPLWANFPLNPEVPLDEIHRELSWCFCNHPVQLRYYLIIF